MTRFIDPAIKRKISSDEQYKIGEVVTGMKATAYVKGRERIGKVVYRRKAIYMNIWDSNDQERKGI
ncbi:hypothetical protein [Metabacillus fastidiosus]|uniref:hypothetical protein n=1 Tax=Metabacillus fastidiosus TaxID=1458 RepID=UPI002DB95195|nr:hypothetical protein [Metabacillus fastidiosus]MEC2076107.1 hypothetical protein [Metabacillus fastidiosus]